MVMHRDFPHLNFDYINFALKEDKVIWFTKTEGMSRSTYVSHVNEKQSEASFKSKTVPSSKGVQRVYAQKRVLIRQSFAPVCSLGGCRDLVAYAATRLFQFNRGRENAFLKGPLKERTSKSTNPHEVHSHGDSGIQGVSRLWILTAFSDADHAGCLDTRKNTSGGIQFLGDKLVSWMSKKQDCTAMSSTEAEYVALSASCAQVMWMRTQLQDYGFNYNKIPLYCDSQSAIAISCNPVQHSRTKHIHTRYHFIKEQVENALPEERFQYLVRRIGMRCLTPAELEVLTKESA
ncbi:hypothetical protein Tco_0163286 [Tanacetum coccineum]